jgi:hypothetical protein
MKLNTRPKPLQPLRFQYRKSGKILLLTNSKTKKYSSIVIFLFYSYTVLVVSRFYLRFNYFSKFFFVAICCNQINNTVIQLDKYEKSHKRNQPTKKQKNKENMPIQECQIMYIIIIFRYVCVCVSV